MLSILFFVFFFFFNDTATTEIYTLSLHDALPILTISAQAFAFLSSASRSAATAGISLCFAPMAAATFIAVGNESFEDCDMFTASLGWTGFLLPSGLPAICDARFAITSFTFMLNWVPLPVI